MIAQYFIALLVIIALFRLQCEDLQSCYTEQHEKLINLCKFCSYCRQSIRPDTHHCVECGVCVEGHDHHCGFFAVCIGDKNAKYFSQFFAFAAIQLMIIGLSHMKFQSLIIDDELSLSQRTVTFMATPTCLVFALILLGISMCTL